MEINRLRYHSIGDIMTQKIIVDSCGWVAIIDSGINFELELERMFGNYELILLDSVLIELEALEIESKRIDAKANVGQIQNPEVLKNRLRAQAASRKMQDAIAGLGTSGQQAISDKNNLAGMLMDMFSSQVGTDVEIFERNLGQNKGLIDAILGADMSKGNSVPNLLQEILDTLNLSQETHLKQFQTVESDRYSNKSQQLEN